MLLKYMEYRLHDVESSNIKSIGYNPETNLLQIVMKSAPKTIYEYKNVPIEKYWDLAQADSIGKYFINEVKGKYDFTKTSIVE